MSATPLSSWMKARARRGMDEGRGGGNDRGPGAAALSVNPPSRRRSRSALFGALLVGLFVFLAFAAPFLTADPGPEDLDGFRKVGPASAINPHPPSSALPLGGIPDEQVNGQFDIWYSLVWGTRTAFGFSLSVVAVSALVGVLIGAASGYLGGWTERLAMGVTDGFLTIPLVAAIIFFRELIYMFLTAGGASVFMNGQVDFWNASATPWLLFLLDLDPVFLAFIVFSWMPYARLMNAAVLTARRAEYIQATVALGAGHGRVLLRHLIPNTISPVLALAARDVGYVILMQTSFAFIGLGSHSEWGQMLALGRNWVIGPGGNPLTYWWVFVPASLFVVLFGVGWNLLGDGLNERVSRTG